MRFRRGKVFAIGVVAGGALVFTVAFWPVLVQEWYLYRLKHGDVGQKVEAIKALSKLGTERAISPLLDLVREQEILSGPLEDALAAALRRIGPEAVPLVVDRFCENDSSDRAAFLPRVLRELKRSDSRRAASVRLLKELESKSTSDQLWAAHMVMWETGYPSTVALSPDDVTETQGLALSVCYTLAHLGPEVVPSLREWVERDDGPYRPVGINLLLAVGIRSQSVASIFTSLLGDSDPRVRADSAEVLWHAEIYFHSTSDEQPSEVTRLQTALRKRLKDSSARVRGRAAVSLSWLFSNEEDFRAAMPGVEEALHDDEKHVRQRAACLLLCRSLARVSERRLPPRALECR